MPCMLKRQENIITGLFVSLLFLAGCAAKPPMPNPTDIPSIPTPTLTPTKVAVAEPSPTPEPCLDATDQVEQGTFSSDFLPEYYIYLPKCYFFDESARYPVLYLLHGQTYTADQWIDLGAVEQATALMDAGEIPPFLIVMPFNHRSLRSADDDEFGAVLVEELIPYIDETYRTLDTRKYRALGGLSRGGAWTIRYGLTRWDLFGALGVHSPAIFYRDDSKLQQWLAEIPADEMPQIYLDIGDRDTGLANALRFEDLLTQMSIVHEWHLYTGWHDGEYWQAHVEEYLRWYGAFFEPEN